MYFNGLYIVMVQILCSPNTGCKMTTEYDLKVKSIILYMYGSHSLVMENSVSHNCLLCQFETGKLGMRCYVHLMHAWNGQENTVMNLCFKLKYSCVNLASVLHLLHILYHLISIILHQSHIYLWQHSPLRLWHPTKSIC